MIDAISIVMPKTKLCYWGCLNLIYCLFVCLCRNLLFSLFDTRYGFESSHLFSCSYVTALREFPRLLFFATQFFTNNAKPFVFVCSEVTVQV